MIKWNKKRKLNHDNKIASEIDWKVEEKLTFNERNYYETFDEATKWFMLNFEHLLSHYEFVFQYKLIKSLEATWDSQ